ncbi:NCS2 family permease [Vibrio sp. PP-XX7]
MLERLFKLSEHGTNMRTEIIAGITTFLTMAYIIFVNPTILADTGMDHGAVFVATCLAAAVGCFIMGLIAELSDCLSARYGIECILYLYRCGRNGVYMAGCVSGCFCSGVLFILLSLFKIREWIINSIPMSLRTGISAGIGLFLAFIALKNAGIIVGNSATLVSLGAITSLPCVLGAFSFFLTIALVHRNVTGAVMISILIVSAIGVIVGNVHWAGHLMSTCRQVRHRRFYTLISPR